ncbi:actin, cytoskeletal 3-like [Labrus bergylta]|uniref:actin, cytoskeletal 3-like n=1 Tax=Labrus bergylta TaxID=56723 RepID=UPI0033139013
MDTSPVSPVSLEGGTPSPMQNEGPATTRQEGTPCWTACLSGSRLKSKDWFPPDTGESVHVTSPKDRDFSVWRGGAVLANLPTFSSAWISQEEYEEYGPQIII